MGCRSRGFARTSRASSGRYGDGHDDLMMCRVVLSKLLPPVYPNAEESIVRRIGREENQLNWEYFQSVFFDNHLVPSSTISLAPASFGWLIIVRDDRDQSAAPDGCIRGGQGKDL